MLGVEMIQELPVVMQVWLSGRNKQRLQIYLNLPDIRLELSGSGISLGDKTGTQNWNKKVSPGPEDLGFDYSCLMAATGDRVPCVWMVNQ